MEVIDGDPMNPRPSCWSAQFCSILGLSTSDDFPNVLDNWASRIHPQDKPEVISLSAAHLADRSGEETVRGDLPDQAENDQPAGAQHRHRSRSRW